MNILLSAVVAYLLGSISPSFFLGKLVKGIDIREHGDGNAGGANTFATVGFLPGIVTVVFDLSKGLISLALASSLFGLSGNLLMIPIAAALAGHVFPFYLRFRGGQGAGTAVGVFFYVLVQLIASGKLPWEAIALVVVIGVVVALVTPAVEFIGVAMIPLLIYEVLHFTGFAFPSSVGALLLVYLLGVTSYNLLRKGILASDAVRGRDWAMVALAVAGTGVLLLRALSGRAPAMIVSLVAALALFALALSGRRHARSARDEVGDGPAAQAEEVPAGAGGPSPGPPEATAPTGGMPAGAGGPSSGPPEATVPTEGMPAGAGGPSSGPPGGAAVSRPGAFAASGGLFYLGALLVTLLYPRPAACLALAFLVGGKLFYEIFGSELGFRTTARASTFRQAIVFFCGCLAAGGIVATSLAAPLPPVLAGAAAAFAALLFVPRPYATAAAGLLGGLALWAVGVLLL